MGASLIALLTFVAGAQADAALRPASGAPDPRQMVITAGDVGGAKVTSQHYYKDTAFPSAYTREFDAGKVGSARFVYLDTEAGIGTSAANTARFFGTTRKVFGTKAFAKEFAKEIEAGTGGIGLVKVTRVGRPRSLGVGSSSFDVAISMRVLGVHTDAHLTVFAVERALGELILVGEPGRRVGAPTMTRLARLVAGRMTSALRPRNTGLPAISGPAQVGQTLTASPGTWSGSSLAFAYQWQRCDSAGGSCADISLATGQGYVLVPADAGSTVRVVVMARNSIGSASATSPATTAVAAAPGTPTPTSPPVVSGTAQVGQTLSATTGSWTGSPTGFAFQWQRCSPAGASCVAIDGATAATYAVVAADRGSTLRVTVTATNGAGSTTVPSTPTAVVP